MFKTLGNLASIARQAQQIGGKMQELNEQMKRERVTANSGAGLVEVEVNGLGEVLNVRIDPSLIEKGEQEMIEDLLPSAINQAAAKAKQIHSEAMQKMAGDMGLPGLDQAMAQVSGQES